jgi:hypothetical protein
MLTRISLKAPQNEDDECPVEKRLAMKLDISKLEKDEEDENPFKKLIDIADLLEQEKDPVLTLHNVCSRMLTNLPQLKRLYEVYSQRIEVVPSDFGQLMTLK